MKANEAPEKLYVELCSDGVYAHIREWKNSDNIEYTRTDAFIDKAVEYIINNMRCDGYTLQTKTKFIKDFKNYMKGE